MQFQKIFRFKFLVLLVVIIVLTGIFFIWQGIYLPLAQNSRTQQIFSIKKGESLKEISFNLEKQGLIKNRFLFIFYTAIKGVSRKLQAGNYFLTPAYNIPRIVQKIVNGEVVRIEVAIPEGFNLNQIEQRLNSKLRIQDAKLQLNTQNLELYRKEFDFLKDAPNNASLEGFLFPDTYYFSGLEKREDIIRIFLNNFGKKLTMDLRKEIKRQDKSIFEIIIMASLLEKEIKDFEDKRIASGILWKRLKNDIPLQVDATITYITGKKTTKVSKQETQIDSPYNTYKYRGLPLGPICNPGLESILAAVYPKDSEYWYYLSTSDGEIMFSKTLEEHNIKKTKYLR